ncbi:Multidrug resistance protein NorM [Lacunisphaera limnophila]|uniref:Multidrug resistance protein NorM n=1 Tax=Lacunisphaera limnophila TaxID=1838286 RepID=A0A1D8AY78_9BACT|nr:MATE family efflux transporter [Lacunisphaera limnophila]AOS45821.1 Multidrug resistance protein NorM [Lacunisphaera limnophila]
MSKPTTTKPPTLLAIAWPIFVEQSLRILIGTVDTFMVAHVSDGAVAALGVSHRLIMLALICFNFIGIGTSVVITHHLGAGDRKGAESICSTALGVNLWMGLIASALMLFFNETLLRLMQLPDSLMVYAVPFMALMGGTLFLEAINTAVGSILRAHGNTRDVMFVTVGQNIINVVGVSLVLFGWFGLPKLGVEGVACASVVSRLLATTALLILLYRRLGIRLHWRTPFDLSVDRIKRILHIGLPAAGEHMSYWLAFLLITSFIGTMGATSLSIMAYAQTVQALVILFSLSLGLGTEIVVGRLIGAGDFEGAYRQLLSSLKLCLMLTAGGMVIIALIAPHLIGLFTHDPEVIAGGALLLRIAFILEIGRVFNIVVINSLRATGDARFPVQIGAVCMWLLWVPNSWLLGVHLGWGLVGIWIAMTCDEWLRGIIMYRRWVGRKWLPFAERSRAEVMRNHVPLVSET